MSEQLTQAEIDALRGAVRSGEMAAIYEQKPSPPADDIKVIGYDFRKPKLLSAERMMKLQLVHQLLLKNLQAMLFSMFKIAGESKLSALEQVSYGEYMLSLAPPTYLLGLQAGPEVGAMGIEMCPPMGQMLLDMLLGGDGVAAAAKPPHEFSAFEIEIMRTLSDRLLEELEVAWKQIHEVSLQITAQGVSPEQVQIAPPETPCLIAVIDLRLNETPLRLQFCYPFQSLQTIFERSEASREDQAGKRTGMRQKLLRALQLVPLPANVELGRAQMTARDLGSLEIGDVIRLDQTTGDPLRLNIGERMVGAAYVGAHRGRLVASIHHIVQPQKADADRKPAPTPASAPAPAPAARPPSAANPAAARPASSTPPPAAARPPAPRPQEKPQPDKTKGHPS